MAREQVSELARNRRAAAIITIIWFPDHRRTGVGRRMMKAAENRLRTAGCPKVNLQVRSSNAAVIEFYKAIGFKTDDAVSLGKRLDPDG